jgi:DNA replication protein DnaC
LADEPTLARADGTYVRLLVRLARADVLVIDDWGHVPLNDADRRDLVEGLDDRYGLRSTIMSSQLPVAKWHDHIGDPTSADAICDRVLHNAHWIVLQAPPVERRTSSRPTVVAELSGHQ